MSFYRGSLLLVDGFISVCLGIWLAVCLSVCLSVCLAVCLSFSLSVSPSASLSVSLYVCLSLCNSMLTYLRIPYFACLHKHVLPLPPHTLNIHLSLSIFFFL